MAVEHPSSIALPSRLSVIVHLHDPGFLSDSEVGKLAAAPLERLASLFSKHPALRLSLYVPGRILDAVAHTAPRAMETLRQATLAERIEWLGGGYHDPLFLLFPEGMRRSQIQMQRQALRTHTQTEPRGVWLPEFVWDPGLVPGLVQSGFTYTVLKDWQIQPLAPGDHPGPGGWHVTEELGQPFRLLSSQESLCALFRAGAVEEMLRLVVPRIAEDQEGGRPAVGVLDIPLLAPSREGFEPVHLERLAALAEICESSLESWRFLLAQDIFRQVQPLSAVCVGPSASKSYVSPGPSGGVRELLRRNPVANVFHKRLLHLAARSEESPNPRVRAQAAEPLMRAQNVAFFRDSDEAGGLRFLRDRVRLGNLLMEAEAALDQAMPDDAVRVDASDLLCEGAQQLLARHSRLGILVEPKRGGRLSELDYRTRLHSWGAVPSPKAVLAEHFTESLDFPEDSLSLEELDCGDFARQAFSSTFKRTERDLQILLSRTGTLTLDGKMHPLTLEKTYTLRSGKSQLTVSYKLLNPGTHLIDFGFACVAALSPTEYDQDHQKHRLASGDWQNYRQILRSKEVKEWEIEDRKAGATLSWELTKPASLEVRPLLSAWPRSPEGNRFEGLVGAAHWVVRLAPGESWSLITRFNLGSVRKVN